MMDIGFKVFYTISIFLAVIILIGTIVSCNTRHFIRISGDIRFSKFKAAKINNFFLYMKFLLIGIELAPIITNIGLGGTVVKSIVLLIIFTIVDWIILICIEQFHDVLNNTDFDSRKVPEYITILDTLYNWEFVIANLVSPVVALILMIQTAVELNKLT